MFEGPAERPPSGGGEAFKVFISYRREDTAADARLIYERVAARLGAENVFLDVVTLQPGTRWLNTIKEQGEASGVCLALIGPRWLSILTERAQARYEHTAEDVVKLELELALRRGSGVEVVPVLVGGAQMPPGDGLPRSLRALSATHAIELRHSHFDQDADALVATLDEIARRRASQRAGAPAPEAAMPPAPAPAQAVPEPVFPAPQAAPPVQQAAPPFPVQAAPPPPPAQAAPPAPPIQAAPPPPPRATSHALGPDDAHYETVIRYLVDQGTVVPLLGSRVSGSASDAERLAADLARRFGLDVSAPDLPRVAQHVLVSSGRPDLLRSLRQILGKHTEPSPVHRFLARFPAQLEQLGLPPQYQMIVTTNYDATLECAFDEENEPYDLAVYVATGADQGRFIHYPFDRDPELISVPNRYGKFPIDDYGELERTVIVKIHGGIGADNQGYGSKDNFVITEDQYIDYLSTNPVESLVPVQILGKLTESHCLFLGYAMRDWHLRVFLKRIWRGEPLGSKSWAIERDPDALEKDFWSQFGVEFSCAAVDEYVEALAQHVLARGVHA